MAGYAFYKGQLPLARAAFSVSWTADHGQILRKIEPALALTELIADELNAGVARGELSRESEVKLRSQMLFDCYLSNYPQAIFEGWSLDAQHELCLALVNQRGWTVITCRWKNNYPS